MRGYPWRVRRCWICGHTSYFQDPAGNPVCAFHLQQAEARLVDQAWEEMYWAFVDRLAALDPEWGPWYDSRPEKTKGEMLPLIEARIKVLAGHAHAQHPSVSSTFSKA